MCRISRLPLAFTLLIAVTISGCSISGEADKKAEIASVIVTPGSYYTTEKARVLGNDYAANLRDILWRIKQGEATKGLQLANNIESQGGLGFFTHSEVRRPDQRYLEVVATMPDIINAEQGNRTKLRLIVSKYGSALLEILASDSRIFGDPRVAGYGLNLGWRQSMAGAPLSSTRAALYVPKETARRFLKNDITVDNLLNQSIIFESRDGKWARTTL